MSPQPNHRHHLIHITRRWSLERAIHLSLLSTALTSFDSVLFNTPAWAQTTAYEYDFNIPSGSLDSALAHFAKVTGITLSFSPDNARNQQSQGLQGRYSPDQALQRLLESSNLRATPQANGSFSLHPISDGSSNDSDMELSAIAVVEDQEHSGSYRAPQTAIGDKFNTPFLDQTQTSYSVTQQVLNDFAVENLEETIKFVPGITVGNNFGGTQDSLVKRGFGSGTDGGVLRDGIRTSRGRNFNSITTERVEVLKGPASLLYGMQEPGGVINVITKKPTYEWRATLGGQMIDEGGGSSYIDVSGPLGAGFAFRLIGQYRDEDYWRNFGVNRDKVIAPSLAFENDKLSFNLSYEYSDYSTVLDRGAFFYNGRHVGSRSRRLDEHWTRINGHRQYASTTLEYRFSPTSRLRFNYGWNEDSSADYQADPNSYNPSTGDLRRRFRSNPNFEKDRYYAALDWLNELNLLGMRHELTLGADHERHDESTDVFLQGPNQWGFFPDSPQYGNLHPVGSPNSSNSNQNSRVRMLSLYAKDNIHIGEHWILSLGLRHQRFRQRDGQGIPYQIGTNVNKSKNLPFAGIVYKINDQFSLYANYSESYKPNTITAGQPTEGGSEPEEGRQYEFGLRYDNGWLSGLITWYDIFKENIQVNENVGGQLVTRTVGEARSRGWEASLNGQLNEHWNLIANYAYTDAEISKDIPANRNNDMVNVARNVAGMFLSYDVSQNLVPGKLRIGGGARYVGKREGDVANTFELSGYTTYDAFVSWSMPHLIGKNARLQLNVDNLTDKHYFVSSGGTNNRVSWGPERIFSLSGSVDF